MKASLPWPRTARLRFEPIQPRHATGRWQTWINDPAVTRWLVSRLSHQSTADLEAYATSMDTAMATIMFALCAHDTGEHVGNLKLDLIDKTHGACVLSIVIGERSLWGKGYATEAIAGGVAYAFDVLGLRRVRAGGFAVNEASWRAFLKCNFQIEGRERAAYIVEGKSHDCVWIGLLKTDDQSWRSLIGVAPPDIGH